MNRSAVNLTKQKPTAILLHERSMRLFSDANKGWRDSVGKLNTSYCHPFSPHISAQDNLSIFKN